MPSLNVKKKHEVARFIDKLRKLMAANSKLIQPRLMGHGRAFEVG